MFCAAAIGTAALSFPIGVVAICFFHFVIGSTYTLGLSYYQTSVVERIHSKKNGQVLSFFDVVSYIGMSAAAYVPMAAARITGVESYVKCFVPVSLVLAAFTVIYIAILCVKGRRN